jgi:mannose/fructose/N-acetylgalactosamine-specific phosphotransferase system component IID
MDEYQCFSRRLYNRCRERKVVTTVQNILDDLIPGLLGLALTFLMMKLLKKK